MKEVLMVAVSLLALEQDAQATKVDQLAQDWGSQEAGQSSL
jgi:hypothetical protein